MSNNPPARGVASDMRSMESYIDIPYRVYSDEIIEELYHKGYNYKISSYLCTRKGIMLYIYEQAITIGNGQDVTKAI